LTRRLRSGVVQADNSGMPQILIADRTMARVLALLPALAIAVAVRLLTLGSPVLAVRVVAAAGIAIGAWIAYRLLTSRVTVSEGGVEVRGVFYEGQLTWTELETVEVVPASRPIRALVWGVMQPQALVLRGRTRTLRPIAAVCRADDEDLLRAFGAIRVRLGAWGIPGQRTAQESVTSV
jgi:hypothetical protein